MTEALQMMAQSTDADMKGISYIITAIIENTMVLLLTDRIEE